MGDQADELLSATEAAHYLDLRHVSMMHKIAEATGMGRRIGRHCMFTKAELDPYDVQRKQLQEQGWKHVRGDQLQLPPALSSDHADEIDVNEAAEILDVSVKRVYQLAEDGRLGTRHGTRWLFTRAEVEAHKALRKKAGRPRKRS